MSWVRYKLRTIFFCFFIFINAGYGQENQRIDINVSQLEIAIQLFKEEKFIESYQNLKLLYDDLHGQTNYQNQNFTQLIYYYIVSGIHCNPIQSLELSEKFLENNIIQQFNERLRYYLGNYYFELGDYQSSYKYFQHLNLSNLTNKEIAILKFDLGYINYLNDNFAEAKKSFEIICQLPNDEFYYDANYYLGIIELKEKKYTQALKLFNKASKNEKYKNILPFYYANIHYYQNQKDSALAIAINSLKDEHSMYKREFEHLIAQIYYDKKMYKEALPYFESYLKSNIDNSVKNILQFAICNYENNLLDIALQNLLLIQNKADSFQNSILFLLANIYLQKNDKKKAMQYFLDFIQFEKDPKNHNYIEFAKFTYIKLLIDLGDYKNAIAKISSFKKEYPNSYKNQIAELNLILLSNSNDYESAYQLYNQLENPSALAKENYPKIVFGLATTYIHQGLYNEAINKLNVLIDYNVAFNHYLNEAYFCKGEILYRKENFNESIVNFKKFIQIEKKNKILIQKGYYNLGYNYLNLKDYGNALKSFYNVINQELGYVNQEIGYVNKIDILKIEKNPIVKDAYLKEADCYYMLKKIKEAKQIYNDFLKYNLGLSDYVTFQKAMIAGAEQNLSEKIKLLITIPQLYPNSSLINDAYLELAESYILNKKFEESLQPLNILLENKNSSEIYIKALYNYGFSLYNLNRKDAALNKFKELEKEFPNAQESKIAIELIKKIYIEQNSFQSFVDYMEQIGKPLNEEEKDNLLFDYAVNKKNENQLSERIEGFQRYLQLSHPLRFIEANYQIAKSFEKLKNPDSAIQYFTTIANHAPNIYAAESFETLGKYYKNKGEFLTALNYLLKVYNLTTDKENIQSPIMNILDLYIQTKLWDSAYQFILQIKNENKLMNYDIPKIIFIEANYFLKNKDTVLAQLYFQKIILLKDYNLSPISQFYISFFEFAKNNLKQAEEECFKFIQLYSYSSYWTTRSYLLLGDIYKKNMDYLNAKATYLSVLESSNNEDLKNQAKERLEQLAEIKKSNSN